MLQEGNKSDTLLVQCYLSFPPIQHATPRITICEKIRTPYIPCPWVTDNQHSELRGFEGID